MQERDGSNQIVRQYAWGASMGGGIGGLLDMQSGGMNYAYLYDGRGNVSAVLDTAQVVAAAYQYNSFGKLMTQAGMLNQPFQFSTKRYFAGTGQSYFGYRFYVASIGKWNTRDPLKETGGINLYGYTDNNPVNYIDPYGLKEIAGLFVNQSDSTVLAQYKDGSSKTYPAATGDGASYPGADADASGFVTGTAWGAQGPYPNTISSWSPSNPGNPYGPAIIEVSGTDGRHIHGTNGPMTNDPACIGGTNPDDRKFTHGCARVINPAIVELKKDVDETINGGGHIPVTFGH